jgi:hypothetical protein
MKNNSYIFDKRNEKSIGEGSKDLRYDYLRMGSLKEWNFGNANRFVLLPEGMINQNRGNIIFSNKNIDAERVMNFMNILFEG